MVAPLAIAAVKYRKPLAMAGGVGASMIFILPIMLTGAPHNPDPPADPCTGGGQSALVEAVDQASPAAKAAKSVSWPLPEPGEPHAETKTNPAAPIPTLYATTYKAAASRFRIPWTLLAGIGMAETGHGRGIHESVAGAQGPMQFLPSTFKAFAIDGDHDGVKDIQSVADSIYTAANYLVKSGATSTAGVRKAIGAYNHSTDYINSVLYYAKQYGANTIPIGSCDAPASGKYEVDAVAAAKHWMGLPYIWGAGTVGPPPGPTGPMGQLGGLKRVGFDCSGLSSAVVAKATGGRLRLNHFSTSQYTTSQMRTVATYSGQGARPLSKMRPGDVIIFNIPLSLGYDSHPWNHVGIYIGGGKMINAAKPGTNVRVDDIAHSWSYPWVARRPLAQYTGGHKKPPPTKTPKPTPTHCFGGVCGHHQPRKHERTVNHHV